MKLRCRPYERGLDVEARDWPESRWIALVLGTTAVAWSGFILHNVADLPRQTLGSPESLYPTIVTVALVVLWLVPATRTAATWALLAWFALHLVGGGILSVLPIGLFPFDPEQSLRHYAFHGVYIATQVPLVWCASCRCRAGDGAR